MGRSLVIVESPAKAKTINKYLGKDFIVKSSVGHVRDLPVSGQGKKNVDASARAKEAAKTRKMAPKAKAAYKKKKEKASLIGRMGIDPDKDWAANYQILPNKEKVIKELKSLAEKADTIYLATDLDREGEAIAWHLREVIGGADSRFKRVVFNEITQTAISEAFEEPGIVDESRVNAQQTRRFLDRIVGYMVSPLLWAKVARGLSAGRVQSVAVRLLVDREREIRAFDPEEFWEVTADTVAKGKVDITLDVVKESGENFRPTSQEQTDKALAVLEKATYKVAKRDDRPTKTRPAAPFITSTLQQAASTRLSFSVKKTMMMAQRLYEAGYITYMRTDSTNLSSEAVANCRDYILDNFGKRYLPESPISYSSKEGAQEAHEAIRPSNVELRGDALTNMERDAQRLYEVIWSRFVACQMPQAEFLSSSLLVQAEQFELKAKGRILKFDGHLRVSPRNLDDDVLLPDVSVGDIFSLKTLNPSQHFTKPPPRFTEASLVKELEKKGIGRPSTYASIISTIQDRGYVRAENRRFYAEKIGEIVTDRLVESFGDLMDFNFTAGMEERLDEISSGEKKWKDVLSEFYHGFVEKLDHAKDDGGMRSNDPVLTDLECVKCGRDMQIRIGGTGVFLGCEGYNLPPKERCKSTVNLIPGEEVISADADDEAEAVLLRSKHRCKKCNTAMESYLIDEGRKLHICGNSPDCDGFEVETGQFKIKGYDGPVIECDKCGDSMELKSGRFGKYFGCNAEECKNTRKLLKNGEAAPPKEDPVPMPHLACDKTEDFFLLRDGAAGIFLAASQFPKHRETRAPLVEEILTVEDELATKFRYLTKAPIEDQDGNKSVVRYSRKTKEQYVMTEVDGKATGWKAFYQGGKWVEEIPAPKKKVAKKKAAKKKVAKKKAAKKKTAKKAAVKKQP